MFCPQCGAPNEDDAVFCGNCGAVLDPEELDVEAGTQEPQQEVIEEIEQESPAGEDEAGELVPVPDEAPVAPPPRGSAARTG